MIQLTADNLKNAVAKAKATKPKVRVIEFRRYEVTNGDGITYTVRLTKIGGKPHGDCDCVATKVCYHIAASLDIHLVLASQMQTV